MATATLMPNPRFVVVDANGAPVSGAMVHTYVPGGTVSKTSWQDAAETIPNSNPIICDAAGSCLLYGSGSYQLTVTDANGVAVPGYSGITTDTLSPLTAAVALLAPLSGFASSFGVSSFTKLPNGYIRQFGIGVSNGSGLLAITFPTTFPTAIRAWGATISVGGFGSTSMAQIGAASTSTMNVLTVASATGLGVAGVSVSWWADGN